MERRAGKEFQFEWQFVQLDIVGLRKLIVATLCLPPKAREKYWADSCGMFH